MKLNKVYSIVTIKGRFHFIAECEEQAIKQFRELNNQLAIDDIIEFKLSDWI